MADPAWGTTSSLSDEETARALCAFHHTESLPTQRHRQPAVPLYQPRSSNHEMQPQRALNARASNGFSAFGYPVHTTHHMVPRSVQRSEATSMLVGIPSTASDDWHRQQQCAIQEQIEQQQRELQAQIHQQQQREMHLQVQRMQVQIQQQEQAQRRQMQVERQAERTQQPRYSSEAGGFEQERWNNEVHTSQAAITASNFHDNRSHDGGMQRQQPGQSYKGRGSSQPGMSTSRSEDIFARLQVPQPAQSHLQTDRTPTFQIQRTQHVLPRQPQPYRPTEVPERIRQAAGPVRSASKSRPDEFVLDGIMKHYQRNVGPPAGAPATSTGAAYDTNSGYSGTRYIKPVFNPSMDQTRIQTQTEIQTQGQLNLHSKVAVPPTGTAAPATSAVPRVENRTVVIFCKRDFMRYQAAKIWRKYQEQLKKHEEWREVRVAGKRTRYLNSRYDELQRTHKRTYTRSGKPRRKASQVAKGARRHNASLSSADSAPADFMVSCSMLADNEIDTRKPGQTADGESVDSGASSNDGGAHSPKAKADEADSDCPMVVHDASEAQEKHSSTIEDKTKSAVESSAFNNSSKGVMACSSAHQGHDGTASGSNIADVAPNGDTVAGAPPCGKLEVTSLPDESPDNVDRSVSDATRKSSAEVTEATLGSNTAISGAVAPLNGSADPELVSNCAIEAAISRIDTIAVAAASSNGTVEVIGLAPDTTMSSAVAKAASVETVATSTASRKNMDTDAKASEDTEERSGNDSARICRERNSPSSVENAQPTLQQSTSTIDNYSCADFSAQNGSPLEQQACPASATTIGDGASININLDKPESSDGVARNNEVKPEESLGGIQPSDPDKATDTDPVMITPHGAVTVEAKQHCTESAPLQDVPDMPACNDPSNGDTAV
ncbi:hypothetical protein PI125_g21373 [Phytophthora idaei]|nr:hypothetical protein PI125_g21373 [Phytophthora idaei]KAG3132985.1 hypothetical protein PI126_g19360 [Phytophthora idaei]